MTSIDKIFEKYPSLTSVGIVGRKGKVALISDYVLVDLFNSSAQDGGDLLFAVAEFVVDRELPRNLKSQNAVNRFGIIHRHFDLATTLLSEAVEYGHNISSLTLSYYRDLRFEKLREVVNNPKSNADIWNAYASYLHDSYEDAGKKGQDLNEIEKWYRKATGHGHLDAMNNLATFLYSYAEDGSPSIDEAISLWIKAAHGGHKYALQNLREVQLAGDMTDVNESYYHRLHPSMRPDEIKGFCLVY